MMELTTLEGFPIFVDIDSLELVEQQEDGTLLCTKSGCFKFVLESAADIYFEIKKKHDDDFALKMAGLGVTFQ